MRNSFFIDLCDKFSALEPTRRTSTSNDGYSFAIFFHSLLLRPCLLPCSANDKQTKVQEWCLPGGKNKSLKLNNRFFYVLPFFNFPRRSATFAPPQHLSIPLYQHQLDGRDSVRARGAAESVQWGADVGVNFSQNRKLNIFIISLNGWKNFKAKNHW